MNSSHSENIMSEEENLIRNSNQHCSFPTSNEIDSELSFEELSLENINKNDYIDTTHIDITPEKSGGVLKRILKEGEGDELPDYGDKVSVHYTGWLLNQNPTVFDTIPKDETFDFSLGRGMVIKAWDLGISTMKKGEIALFICYPKYAYGEMGYLPTIPPHTPLLFHIELLGWKLEDLSPKKDNSILRKTLVKGDVNVLPNEGSQVKVNLVRYDGDKIFEDEVDFVLGEGCNANIPEGIEIALLKFRLKERSLIYLRNKYATDFKETPESSYDSQLEIKYEVTLINFEKVKDIWDMNSDEKFERAKLAREKGITFFKAGHYKIALKQFKWIITCLEKEPGVSPDSQESRMNLLLSGYLNMALCCLKLDNFVDAIKVCDKALANDPDNEKALFRRGQAKVQINDCEEAMHDFEALNRINPDNKAALNFIILCQNKIKKQKLKDKGTYNKMFEIFVKQDEERLKNMKTETGIWQDDEKEVDDRYISDTDDLMSMNSAALLDANVIEISNTANEHLSYDI